jgi:hypothetical protein
VIFGPLILVLLEPTPAEGSLCEGDQPIVVVERLLSAFEARLHQRRRCVGAILHESYSAEAYERIGDAGRVPSGAPVPRRLCRPKALLGVGESALSQAQGADVVNCLREVRVRRIEISAESIEAFLKQGVRLGQLALLHQDPRETCRPQRSVNIFLTG